jgi:hypothetical protein
MAGQRISGNRTTRHPGISLGRQAAVVNTDVRGRCYAPPTNTGDLCGRRHAARNCR